MKKVAAILLLLLYLPAISGVAVSKQFCCGKIASVKIQLVVENKGHPAHQESKGCCSEINDFFKIHAPQQVVANDISFTVPVLSIPGFMPVAGAFSLVKEDNYFINNGFFYSSPPQTMQPLFLRNEAFLI